MFIECLLSKSTQLGVSLSSVTSPSLVSMWFSSLSAATKLLVHPTKRVHCSIFIHTDKGSVKCPHAPPPYIFCRFTSWMKGFRMTPFSSVISFLSGVLGSSRLAIVDDLGLPRGVLNRYESISPGHSKPFVDFNTATSLWSNCGFVFTWSVLSALWMDSRSLSSWSPSLSKLSLSIESSVILLYSISLESHVESSSCSDDSDEMSSYNIVLSSMNGSASR